MVALDVVTDDLRAAASMLDGVVRSATSTPRAPDLPDVGHAELAAAITSFVATASSSWTDRLAATSGAATGLRRSASMYDDADDAGAGDLATRRAVVA